MAFSLPDLPYAKDALAPHISAETIEYHYGKHHNAYVTNLNGLVEGTEFAGKSLEEIIAVADGGLFNNAAQVWNHSFYWKCMRPGGGGAPDGDLEAAIANSFGSFGAFKEQFAKAGATLFGSGWVWLVVEDGSLKITQTSNADLPMRHGQRALLTMDVWEHAYYVDFRNARPQYIEAFLNELVDWSFVEENFVGA